MKHNHRKGAKCAACVGRTRRGERLRPREPGVRTVLTETELDALRQLLAYGRMRGLPQTTAIRALTQRAHRLSGMLRAQSAQEAA